MRLQTLPIVCIFVLFGDSFATENATTGTTTAPGIQSMILETFGQALAPQIEKLGSQLGNWLVQKLFGPVTQQVILGRSVQAGVNGNTASIRDISSGITVVGHGNTEAEAMAEATEKLILTLYQGNFLSVDDLHLAPVRTTTLPPCVDSFPARYCETSKNLGACSPSHASYGFMYDHCLKTCTGC